MFDFKGLTPDTILDALESIGIYPQSGLQPLNSYENRVYQFLEESGKRFVVKFYRPERWTNEQIIEEHEFALELDAASIPAIPPLVINQQTLFEFQGYRFCLYNSIGGRMFELDNLDQLEWLGRLLGRLHGVGKTKSFQHRPTLSFEHRFTSAREVLKECEHIPQYLHGQFFQEWDRLTETVINKLPNEYSIIRLHGDCHSGNLLAQRDNLLEETLVVDFDDCLNGPAIQDMWMMLNGDRSEQLLQLDTLLMAYQEFNDFDMSECALIEPLRARRMLEYMAWIAARWTDPAFPIHFSWFATEAYWQQQVQALSEQTATLLRPPLQLGF